MARDWNIKSYQQRKKDMATWQEEKREMYEELGHVRNELAIERKLTADLNAQIVELKQKLSADLTESDEVCDCGIRPVIDAALQHSEYVNLYNHYQRLAEVLDKMLPLVNTMCVLQGPTAESEDLLTLIRDFNKETRRLKEEGNA